MVGASDLEGVEDEVAAAPERGRRGRLVEDGDVDGIGIEDQAVAPEDFLHGVAEREGGCAGRAGDVGLPQASGVAHPDGGGEDAGDALELLGGTDLRGAGGLAAEECRVDHRVGARQWFVAWSAARIPASSGECSTRAAPVRATGLRPPMERAATMT